MTNYDRAIFFKYCMELERKDQFFVGWVEPVLTCWVSLLFLLGFATLYPTYKMGYKANERQT